MPETPEMPEMQVQSPGPIPGGRSTGVGNGNLLQYSCLENSKDRGNGNLLQYACLENSKELQTVGHDRACSVAIIMALRQCSSDTKLNSNKQTSHSQFSSVQSLSCV